MLNSERFYSFLPFYFGRKLYLDINWKDKNPEKKLYFLFRYVE